MEVVNKSCCSLGLTEEQPTDFESIANQSSPLSYEQAIAWFESNFNEKQTVLQNFGFGRSKVKNQPGEKRGGKGTKDRSVSIFKKKG